MPQTGFPIRTRMYYGNYEFGPVPTFSWETQIVRDGADEPVYKQHTLSFNGFLIVDSTSESGQLDSIITKQNNLRSALGSGNQEWRITYDGDTIVSGVYPRVEQVSIDEGLWVDRAAYTFSFVYDEDFESTNIKSYSESWDYNERDDRRTVEIGHSISAVGQNTNPSGASNALTNAKDYVLAKTGYSNSVSSSPFFTQVSGVSSSAFETLRTENIDVEAGSYGVNETFILSSGNYVHTNTAQYNIDENGIISIQLDGNIEGLGRGDNAYDNALIAWSSISGLFPSRASGVYNEFGGGATLYTRNYESFSVTKNKFAGTISYSVSYTDDPSEDLPDGIKEATLSIQDNEPQNVYATFSIPLRSAGALFQDIGTKSVGSYTLNGNIIGEPSVDFSILENYMTTKINEKQPTGKSEVYKTASSTTKDHEKKTLQFSVTWQYNN